MAKFDLTSMWQKIYDTQLAELVSILSDKAGYKPKRANLNAFREDIARSKGHLAGKELADGDLRL